MFIRLLLISIVFLSINVRAADDGDWWLQREVKLQQNREDYARRVYGRALKTFDQVDATGRTQTLTKVAIAEAAPTASKVGASMMQRVAFYAKNPGVQMIGVIAVTQLIEAIGWVMEEGSYVKHKPLDPSQPDPSAPKIYVYQGGVGACYGSSVFYSSSGAVADSSACFTKQVNRPGYAVSTQVDGNTLIVLYRNGGDVYNGLYDIRPNPLYDPNAQQPKDSTVSLTPELLGAAMMGEGYHDPVDSNLDASVNSGQMHQSVADAYQHSGNSVGDDLANDMDNKLKNAPQTTDGKPAVIGDPRYLNPPTESNPNSNDRSYINNVTNVTNNTTTTNNTTNETTTSSSTTQIPAFCEWASIVCKWIGWTQEQPELKDEKLEIEQEDIQTYQRQDSVVFGKTCPFTPERVSIPMGLVGSIDFDKDLSFFCTYGAQAAPYIQGLGYLGSLIFLMLGLRNGNA